MNKVLTMEQFEELLEGLGRFIPIDKAVKYELVNWDLKLRHRFTINTKKRIYHIIIRDEEDGRRKSYMGCTMKSRKGGGRDLADGEFTVDTWLRFLTDVVSLELVPVDAFS